MSEYFLFLLFCLFRVKLELILYNKECIEMSNKFKGTGNLGRAPELKYINTADGQRAVANFSVRFDRDKRTDNGEYVDNGGFWLDVAIFGNQAMRVVETLSKGNRVFAEGSLKQQIWDKDGVAQSRLILEASYIALDLLGVESIQYQQKNTTQSAPASGSDIPPNMDDLPPVEQYTHEAANPNN